MHRNMRMSGQRWARVMRDGNRDGDGGAGGGGQSGSESEGQSGQGESGQQSGPESGSERGFPEGTPIAEMTPEQQTAYWKHQSRRWEGEAKKGLSPAELKTLRDKAAAHDALEEANKTELQKANDRIAELAARNTQHEITRMRQEAARAAGLSAEDAEWITADDADTAKGQAERLAERLKTTGSNGTSFQQGYQGERNQVTSSVASGRELYREKHAKK
jgi:hypothetical protein